MTCKGFVNDFVEKVATNLELFMVLREVYADEHYVIVIGVFTSLDLAMKQICMCMTNSLSLTECLQKIPVVWDGPDYEHQEGFSQFHRQFTIDTVKINDQYKNLPEYIRRPSNISYALKPFNAPATLYPRYYPTPNGFALVCLDCYQSTHRARCAHHNSIFEYENDFLNKFNSVCLEEFNKRNI